ncbi:TonB-dependent siderophore receptor [Xylophilus sp. Kf1]|nr:TonB-dependent siderophore receptor [Xylophilus sp. Kf1]
MGRGARTPVLHFPHRNNSHLNVVIQPFPTPLLVGLVLSSCQVGSALAQAPAAPDAGTLPTIRVQGGADDESTFRPKTAPGVAKSSVPLSEIPQSITVVPPALLRSQQAQSLGDALANVPGVVSQTFGRRGWDDLIIRGQTASDAIFVDGLRTSANNRVAQELFGVDRVEVLKGPASLLYGRVLPGGMVNMTSKRPGPEAFANIDATVGSYGLRQGSFDINRPLESENGKAGIRLNGLAMHSDDATDQVWFRNRFLAPSLSMDFGARTDFTILASYQERSYLRQQGLPLSGSVLFNRNGRLPLDRFAGEPGQRPYEGHQSRLGYALTHRFDSGWTLNQNLRRQEYAVAGQLVAITSLAANSTNLLRSGTDQQFSGRSDAVDTNVQRVVRSGFGTHEITLGTDYSRDQELSLSRTCSVAALNIFNPVYGARVACPSAYRTNSLVTVRSLGVYGRDQIQFGDRTRVVLGLRRDSTSVATANNLNGARQNNPADATTGTVGVMYEVLPGVRPYASYATSFFPNSGLDAQNRGFDPESGRQLEGGVKWDLDGGRTGITAAVYDLRRRNVLQTDPANTGYSIAVGEQRTRGAELGIASDLRNGLSLFGGYAYTDGKITGAGAADAASVGQPLNNVPRNSFTLSSRYRFQAALRGWEVSAGVRGQGKAAAYTYTLPGYTVADVGVAYDTARWHAAFNIRNLFDQGYYTGGLAAAVAVGTPRTALLTVGYRY